jgi:hypothetical protein
MCLKNTSLEECHRCEEAPNLIKQLPRSRSSSLLGLSILPRYILGKIDCVASFTGLSTASNTGGRCGAERRIRDGTVTTQEVFAGCKFGFLLAEIVIISG